MRSIGPGVETTLRELALVCRTRLLDGDHAGVESLLAAARLAGVSLVDVHAAIIAPALSDIGLLWARGELSIADEHMATEIASAALLRLGEPARTAGPLAVVACGPDELHALGARTVSTLLGERGWRVAHLGARTPADALEDFVAQRRPALVALSIKRVSVPALQAQLRRLRRLSEPPKVLVGGAAVGELAGVLEADHVDDDVAGALGWVDGTFGSPPAPAPRG